MANQYKKLPYQPFYGDSGLREVSPRIGFDFHRKLVNRKNYDAIMAEMDKYDSAAIDTETTSLDFDNAKLVCICFSFGEYNYIALTWHQFLTVHKDELPTYEQVGALVKKLVTKKRCFYWNRYYDERILLRAFPELTHWDFKTSVDGLDLLWMLDTNVKSGRGLKESGRKFLGIEREDFEEMIGDADEIYSVPIKTLLYYGCLDGYETLHLGEMLYGIFARKYPFLLKLHIEFKHALFNFEEQTQTLDLPYLEKLKSELDEEIESTKEEFYSKYGVINLGSNHEKSKLLESLGYSTGRYGKPNKKTGIADMSVSKELLQNLVDHQDCDPARLMLKYSQLSTLQNNFVAKTANWLNDGNTPRFYFIDNNVPTARIACGSYKIKNKPINYFIPLNLMAIPKGVQINRRVDVDFDKMQFNFNDNGKYLVESTAPKLNFRKMILPPNDDYMIVRGDFSAEELCITANESGETVWLETLASKGDLHRATAKAIWPDREIDGNLRKKAKIANFLMLYGGSPAGLAAKMKVSQEEGEEVYQGWWNALPHVKTWAQKLQMEARRTGTITNCFGMPRRLWYYYHGSRGMQEFADRSAVNTCIQGAAGIMGRLAMVKLNRMIYEPGAKYAGVAQFVDMVHDELVVAVRRDIALEFIRDFYKTMRSVSHPKWKVPVDVGLDVGNNYGELVPVEFDENMNLRVIAEEEHHEVEQVEETFDEFIDEEDDTDSFGGLEF